MKTSGVRGQQDQSPEEEEGNQELRQERNPTFRTTLGGQETTTVTIPTVQRGKPRYSVARHPAEDAITNG